MPTRSNIAIPDSSLDVHKKLKMTTALKRRATFQLFNYYAYLLLPT